ncbi:hypothetical protein V8E54_013272 [Elaphomyces granulatus]|jgi:hypothetical protein
MTYSSADKRRVYLACRPIFTGNNALLRKQKKIRELLDKHKSPLHPLVRDFDINKIVEILKILLEKEIFQSEVKAKIEFPELFQSSPERSVQRTASENDAARSMAEALEDIESLEAEDELEDGEWRHPDSPDHDVAVVADQIHASLTSERLFDQSHPVPIAMVRADVPVHIPSLYPSYLPFRVQHVILSTAQRVLEECCFDFAKKWLPSILERRRWDCAAAVELTKWTRILAKDSSNLPPHAFSINGPSLNEVIFAASKIRHTAVHRLPTTARGVHSLIKSAVKMTEALQDSFRTAQLEELHGELESKIKSMELNKNALEDGLARQLQEIQRQRAELERKEQELSACMLRDDQENRSLIGVLLEESVKKLFQERPILLELTEVKTDDDEAMEAIEDGIQAPIEKSTSSPLSQVPETVTPEAATTSLLL